MYSAFWDFLYEDFGLTDDEIFSEFQGMCADANLFMVDVLLGILDK